MAGVADVHRELPIGRVEAGAGNPTPAGNVVVFAPVIGQAAGNMEANEALAGADEFLHAVPLALGQPQVRSSGHVLPARIKDQGIVATHLAGVGQD